MEAILNRRKQDLEDYYGLLGCDELSSTEQIVSEFKVRALACHPDKHPENPKAVEEFQKLQEAKEVLTDEKKRKNYDLWLRSRIAIPFSEWRALSDSVKTSMHWAARSKKEPMLEAAKDPDLADVHEENLSEEKPSESCKRFLFHGYLQFSGYFFFFFFTVMLVFHR
uniref:DnaJ homolog subfamily C member 12 n=1 Tax=Cyprinus carpio TaxID=7962 RepID=A0A8C1RKR0_CYPCA